MAEARVNEAIKQKGESSDHLFAKHTQLAGQLRFFIKGSL